MTAPTCADLASDELEHRYDDMFNPPGLTNFLGAAQVDTDVVAVRSVNFPPFSQGDTVSGQLFLDGRLVRSFGEPVRVTWRPDYVERVTRADGLEIRTRTACPPGACGVVVDIRVRRVQPGRDRVRLGLALNSRVVRSVPWRESVPPSGANHTTVVAGCAAVIGMAADGAVCVQGLDAATAEANSNRVEVLLDLEHGEQRVGYVQLLGDDAEATLARYAELAGDVPGAIAASTAEWDAELAAAFTPGNSSWSGCLPVLHTNDDALRRLYHLGALGVIYMRRDTAASMLGRAYETLLPRYWQTTTFIWDYMLSSVVHALLDPVPMRRQLTHWISLDIHTHFGTEYQTGSPVGYWYAVNDYAMVRLVRDYVRFSGDLGFLDERLAAADGTRKPVGEHVVDAAQAWRGLRGPHGLADYGGIDNLLECVSSYVHEVASFNATNAWALRAAAELLDSRGDPARAAALRDEAGEVVQAVNALYVPGGYWRAGQPDGSAVEVQHCLDFANVAFALSDDLTPAQRHEMVEFFTRELQTESWLRSLSPWDPDASFSVRPDHQWNGAYTAWPADAARALIALGRDDLAGPWLRGLARSANQGPFAQAHFTLEAAPGVNGGARKAPPQPPYLIDWACSSSGAWVGLVLESMFGLRVPVGGEPSARPRLQHIDPTASLSGLVVAGRTYGVTAKGVHPEG